MDMWQNFRRDLARAVGELPGKGVTPSRWTEEVFGYLIFLATAGSSPFRMQHADRMHAGLTKQHVVWYTCKWTS
jgi:hypothetical protein